MTDRSPLSVDDFVGSFGAGAETESADDSAMTQPSDPVDETTDNEAVEAEEEQTEEQPEQEDASAEDVEDDEDVETETVEEETDEVETDDDETTETDDQDDEEVLEESFTWNDSLEIDVPDLGKMTLEELRRGHLREGDHTRKTQKLAALERELTAKVEADRESLANERQQLTQRREALDATLDVMREQYKAEELSLEELEKLYNEDPDAFQKQQFEAMRRQKRMEEAEKQATEARAEIEKVEQTKAEEAKKNYEAYLAEQRAKLHEAKSEWADETALDKSLREFSKLVEPFGFSQDEIFQITEARQLLLLDSLANVHAENARLQGELEKAVTKAKKVETAKPALKKKVVKAAKRMKPVSSEPVQPKDKAVAFRDRIMKKHGAMTADEFAKFHLMGGR